MTFEYKKSTTLSSQINRLLQAKDIGFKLLFGVVAASVIFSKIKNMISEGASFSDWVSIVLTGITVVVGIFWFFSPKWNLDLANNWLAETTRRTNPQAELMSAIGVAAIFTILLLSTFRPVIYSIAFLLYSIVYLFGVRQYHSQLVEVFANSRARLKQEAIETPEEEELREVYQKAIGVLEQYHLHRPHQTRIILFIIVGCMAILFSLVLQKFWSGAGIAALVLCGLALVMGEIAISVWRVK